MIQHQSPFGHIILFPTEVYYSLTDKELRDIEERYMNINSRIITFGAATEEDFEE